jgi:hypothetical protein
MIGGIASWAGSIGWDARVDEYNIRNEACRRLARIIVAILWAYTCGILYSVYFAALYKKEYSAPKGYQA